MEETTRKEEKNKYLISVHKNRGSSPVTDFSIEGLDLLANKFNLRRWSKKRLRTYFGHVNWEWKQDERESYKGVGFFWQKMVRGFLWKWWRRGRVGRAMNQWLVGWATDFGEMGETLVFSNVAVCGKALSTPLPPRVS